jgi:hypothetical protein
VLYDNHRALMVDEADELYAVWDGKRARSYGGTADVVAYAREHGTALTSRPAVLPVPDGPAARPRPELASRGYRRLRAGPLR